jgi:hypothetical protein
MRQVGLEKGDDEKLKEEGRRRVELEKGMKGDAEKEGGDVHVDSNDEGRRE